MSIKMLTLRKIRAERNLSQNDIGKIVGSSRNVVSFWESGRNNPPLDKAIMVADFLGISLDTLCGRIIPKSDKAEQAKLKALAQAKE